MPRLRKTRHSLRTCATARVKDWLALPRVDFRRAGADQIAKQMLCQRATWNSVVPQSAPPDLNPGICRRKGQWSQNLPAPYPPRSGRRPKPAGKTPDPTGLNHNAGPSSAG
eukprot:1191575-Prorocentrum_minimum.AAC.1